ncbi:hypothetical protein MMC13_008370 [Lambiella insularis]|nr:hypothetical protein [Lambiella insularis]
MADYESQEVSVQELPLPNHIEGPGETASALSRHSENDPSFESETIVRKRTHADLLQRIEPRGDCQASVNIEVGIEEQSRGWKRSRLADWPFKGVSVAPAKQPNDRDVSRRSPSLQHTHKDRRSEWLSKFKEGSMNDRPSNQPPTEYIGHDQLIQDQLMEQYMAERQQGRVRASEDTGMAYSAGVLSGRPSSMYRFGKALVNAFNPIMVWNGLNGRRKEKSEEELRSETTLLDERRMKAEKAYVELKKDGYPGTRRLHPRAPSSANEPPSADAASTLQTSNSVLTYSRDSGIDVDYDTEEALKVPPPNMEIRRQSNEHKEDGIAFEARGEIKLPSYAIEVGPSVSPGPSASSGPKLSLRLQKPSFSNLRKIKSHIHLPSTKRHSVASTPIPSIEIDASRMIPDDNALKRQPSKKDFQKHEKLSKRVSDLENQLEKARREFLQSMDHVPPVPPLPTTGVVKPFLPRGLASLPSGRFLDEPLTEPIPVSPDTTVKLPEKGLGVGEVQGVMMEPQGNRVKMPVADQLFRLDASIPKRGTAKKRKSASIDDLAYKPDPEDCQEMDIPKEKKRLRAQRPRKVGKQAATSELTRPDDNCDSALLEITNTPSKNPSMTVANSSEDVSFDPTKVDKVKMLAMRSNPNNAVPFGMLSDDIQNLKKEFPSLRNDQLIKYITGLSDGKQHPPRISSKNVFPPVSPAHHRIAHDSGHPHAIPGSKSYRKPHRPLSPPPAHDDSGDVDGKLHNAWVGGKEDGVIRISPTKDKNVPPVPLLPKELESQKAKVHDLEVDGEDWKWDDDVF